MSTQPRPGRARDAIMIRVRTARTQALVVGLIATGGILGLTALMQSGLAGAIGSVANVIGAVTGG